MKKQYLSPELEVNVMSEEDILSASAETDVLIDVKELFN